GRIAALPGRDPFALAGLSIYLAFALVAIFADQIASHDPLEMLFQANGRLARSLPPSAAHLLGTTNGGRDIFSQLVYGTRAALSVGLSAAIAVALIGTLVGLVAGYFGGWIDSLLMRLAGIALSIP